MTAISNVAWFVFSASATFAVSLSLAAPLRWPPASELPFVELPAPSGEILQVRGGVQRKGTAGWTDLEEARPTFAGDMVRVGPSSSTRVALGQGGVLEVGSNSELYFTVDGEVGLAKGIARPSGDAPLRVVFAANRAVHAERDVRLLIDGAGELMVENRAGVAWLMIDGARIEVPAGEVARIAPGGTSANFAPLPTLAREINVRRPPRTAAGEMIVVTGNVPEGAGEFDAIIVGGVVAELMNDGSFRAEVPLTIGENKVVLVIRDVFGDESVYSTLQVRRLTESEIRRMRFKWTASDDTAETTWGAP